MAKVGALDKWTPLVRFTPSAGPGEKALGGISPAAPDIAAPVPKTRKTTPCTQRDDAAKRAKVDARVLPLPDFTSPHQPKPPIPSVLYRGSTVGIGTSEKRTPGTGTGGTEGENGTPRSSRTTAAVTSRINVFMARRRRRAAAV